MKNDTQLFNDDDDDSNDNNEITFSAFSDFCSNCNYGLLLRLNLRMRKNLTNYSKLLFERRINFIQMCYSSDS